MTALPPAGRRRHCPRTGSRGLGAFLVAAALLTAASGIAAAPPRAGSAFAESGTVVAAPAGGVARDPNGVADCGSSGPAAGNVGADGRSGCADRGSAGIAGGSEGIAAGSPITDGGSAADDRKGTADNGSPGAAVPPGAGSGLPDSGTVVSDPEDGVVRDASGVADRGCSGPAAGGGIADGGSPGAAAGNEGADSRNGSADRGSAGVAGGSEGVAAGSPITDGGTVADDRKGTADNGSPGAAVPPGAGSGLPDSGTVVSDPGDGVVRDASGVADGGSPGTEVPRSAGSGPAGGGTVVADGGSAGAAGGSEGTDGRRAGVAARIRVAGGRKGIVDRGGGVAVGRNGVGRAASGPWSAVRQARRELVEPDERLALETALGLPRTGGYDLAPDGRRAVVAVALGYRSSLFLVAGGAAPGELTRGRGWDSAPRFAGDGQSVIFVSGRRPRGLEPEGGRLFRLRLGGEPEPLTGGDLAARAPAVSPDGSSAVSPDGERVAFLGRPVGDSASGENGENGENRESTGYDLWTVPVGGGEPRRVTSHPGDEGAPVWSPDGRFLAYAFDAGLAGFSGDLRGAPAPTRSGVAIVAVVAASGSPGGEPAAAPRVLLTDTALPPRGTPASAPTWTPDGAGLVWAAPFAPGAEAEPFDALYLLDASGEAEPRPLVTAAGSDLSEPAFRPAPGSVPGNETTVDPDAFAWDLAWIADDGVSRRLHRAALRRDGSGEIALSGRVRVVTRGRGVASDPRWTADGSRLAALHEAAVSPRDLWIFPLAGGRERLSDTLFPELDVRAFSRPEVLEVTSADGFATNALLYRPGGSASRGAAEADAGAPLLVYLRGPAGGEFGGGFEEDLGGGFRAGFDPLVQLLAERGYAVLVPNVRGGRGRGGSFAAANDGDWGGGDLADLVAAARAAPELPGVAPDRAGVFGVGYGGFLALAALARHPDLFVCGVEAMGTADFVRLRRDLDPARRRALENELGPLRGNLAVWRRLSLTGEGAAVRAPLLSFHGEEVPESPYAAKESFLDELRRRADYPLAELYFRGDSGRAVFRPETDRGAAYGFLAKVLEFLSLHLPTD